MNDNPDNPSTSPAEQVEKLKRRGMVIEDEAEAKHHLRFISYYRLRAYWDEIDIKENGVDSYRYKKDTSFNTGVSLYFFDRKLRLLVLDAIDRVEVACRACWEQHMAGTHNIHSYLERKFYDRTKSQHNENVDRLLRELNRSHDITDGYQEKYNRCRRWTVDPADYSLSLKVRHDNGLPPVWVAAEALSFGMLLHWIEDLRSGNDKGKIAKPFNLNRGFASTCNNLVHVRNICAHHGRLWDRKFEGEKKIVVGKLPKKLQESMRGANSNRLHNTLVVLDHMLSIIAPKTGWRSRVVDLINRYDKVVSPPCNMGFPKKWRLRSAWKVDVKLP
ncbi:MAG: Abi family protein [Pseudohongiellaceae bacterium]